jgi:serine/threonine-protein kinase
MSSNATSAPEPGQTLAGKYLVEEVLGVGGMGVVVAAKHLQLDQKVAIKYLLPAALLNPEVVERFAREARAAAKIRGEHVARVIDVGQFDDGAPYMVMEHLEGHDLAKHLELYGPLPVEDAVRFLLETCEALAEAHSAKIVHRDLKPSNMFLSKQPDKSAIIKVLDFGISKTGDAPSASLTKTSALMGTAFYMSPEQLTNPKGVDHRSDIWSLGVILYELLAGRQPFMGESVPEIIGAILSNNPDGLRTLRADVPVGLETVIVKCMQTKAADRYQSVAGLAAALGPFAHVRDRLSIDITARVLGEAVSSAEPAKNPNLAKATVLGAPPPTQQTGPQSQQSAGSTLPSQSTPSSQATPGISDTGAGASAPAVGAVTTHALATSAITTTPKKTPVPLLAGVAALVIAAAVFGGMKLSGGAKNDAPAAAATGLVAPPPVVAPQATAATTTTILPANGSTNTNPPPPDPSPAPPTPVNAGTPNSAPAPRGNAPIAARPGAPVAAAPASAKPGAPAAQTPPASAAAPPPATVAAPAPAAPPAPAPATSSKSNPLQMGIK